MHDEATTTAGGLGTMSLIRGRRGGVSLWPVRTRRSRIGAMRADYLALMKPRVMSLVVFTVVVAERAHTSPIAAELGAALCIAIGAGAAGALNMLCDADIDAVMARAAARPIGPDG